MPHIFQAESAESEHLAQTPHGLCTDSAWTGRLPIWHRSPHNWCFQSVQSPHRVRASPSRNPVRADCPNYLIRFRKNWHLRDSNPCPLGIATRTAARLFGHCFLSLLCNKVPQWLGLGHVTPNEATMAPTPDQLTTTTTTTTTHNPPPTTATTVTINTDDDAPAHNHHHHDNTHAHERQR